MDTSWFLDEANFPKDEKALPRTWRLGSRPNLRQMHFSACKDRVKDEAVESLLTTSITKVKDLTAGASAAGAIPHVLPVRPNDIEDDGDFHYAVLGPKSASTSGNPSVEAKRYIEETTGPDKPRQNKNAIVLAVPSRDGLDAARSMVRNYLGWEEVREMVRGQELDPIRAERLGAETDRARGQITEAIRQAYCIDVTQSAAGDIQAFKLTPGSEPLFTTIKADPRARIEDNPVSANALLPGGPYNLWAPNETSRRVKDLVGSFAQVPKLPKMLRRREIIDTLADGARQGFFVLRQVRPDKSVRAVWRQNVGIDEVQKDASWEVVLPEVAELSEVSTSILTPNVLPDLWPPSGEVAVNGVVSYFAGGKVVKVQRLVTDGSTYDESVQIPKAAPELVRAAVMQAIEAGNLWLISGPASICGEPIPAGVMTDAAKLAAPPAPIDVNTLLPEALPGAWAGNETTAIGLSTALSASLGKLLPWPTVRDAIDRALRARLLERTADSGPWPCPVSGAGAVKVRLPEASPIPPPPPPLPRRPGVLTAEAELSLSQLQDLADAVGDILKSAVPHQLKFTVKLELGGDATPDNKKVEAINSQLAKISDSLKLRE